MRIYRCVPRHREKLIHHRAPCRQTLGLVLTEFQRVVIFHSRIIEPPETPERLFGGNRPMFTLAINRVVPDLARDSDRSPEPERLPVDGKTGSHRSLVHS